jgi:hypothetical protein
MATPTQGSQVPARVPGEVEMRRIVVALAVVVMLLAAYAPMAVATSGPASPLRGVIVDMATQGPCPITSMQPVPDPGGCWYGHVVGDINGRIAFWEDPPKGPNERSVAAHFFELFTFLPDTGGWIVGYDDGHWSQWTKFHASGFVTAASPGLAGMVGYRFFEMGVTTCGEEGCTAFGTEMFLAKAMGTAAD